MTPYAEAITLLQSNRLFALAVYHVLRAGWLELLEGAPE